MSSQAALIQTFSKSQDGGRVPAPPPPAGPSRGPWNQGWLTCSMVLLLGSGAGCHEADLEHLSKTRL